MRERILEAIYKKLDIGTAKPSKEEMQGIQHYLLDFVEPNQRYSVAEFKKDAENAIDEILTVCADRTELFVPTTEDKFKFFHRSFFEYFYSERGKQGRLPLFSHSFNADYGNKYRGTAGFDGKG